MGNVLNEDFQEYLKALNETREILFFPDSFKKRYHFTEKDNAKILSRTETLDVLNKNRGAEIIVTYTAAIAEKVIDGKSFTKNTF